MSPGFSSPPDPKTYNSLVYEIARQIPPGKVATYGQIAALIPPPSGWNLHSYESVSPRWVGSAMAACPDDVPWQRVINAQGKISLRNTDGPNIQRQLLEEEGVVFDAREKVDLKRFRWSGPSREWLQAHELVTSGDEPEGGESGPQIKMDI